MEHPDMRDRSSVSTRMTKQFAQDLNLVMASHRLTDVSYVIRESVAAQADAIRVRITERLVGSKADD
jgi:hypothetical protein